MSEDREGQKEPIPDRGASSKLGLSSELVELVEKYT